MMLGMMQMFGLMMQQQNAHMERLWMRMESQQQPPMPPMLVGPPPRRFSFMEFFYAWKMFFAALPLLILLGFGVVAFWPKITGQRQPVDTGQRDLPTLIACGTARDLSEAVGVLTMQEQTLKQRLAHVGQQAEQLPASPAKSAWLKVRDFSFSAHRAAAFKAALDYAARNEATIDRFSAIQIVNAAQMELTLASNRLQAADRQLRIVEAAVNSSP
jgi:hypothetical protein